MTEHRTFNHRKRWLLRNQFSVSDSLSGVGVLGTLAVVVGWIALQGAESVPAGLVILPCECSWLPAIPAALRPGCQPDQAQ